MTLANPLILGGISVATVRDTYRLSHSGGASEIVTTANGGRVGQRGALQPTGLAVQIYPLTPTDAEPLHTLLSHSYLLPLITPGGTRYAVRPPDTGHPLQGWIDNDTARYDTAWTIERTALLTDYHGRGLQPGLNAYHHDPGSVYSRAGWPTRFTLIQDLGWQLTGTGTYSDTHLAERTATGIRRQVVLEADVSIGFNATVALGLAVIGTRTNRPFGTDGIGVEWTPTACRILGDTDSLITSITPGVIAGRYQVRIVARSGMARVEIFQGRTRLLWSATVPWPAGRAPGAILNVKTGTATLHSWSVVEV